MKKYKVLSGLLCFICSLITTVFAQSAEPMFSFSALTPTLFFISKNQTAIVQYTVTNRSHKTHTLMLKPIAGMTQITGAGFCSSAFVLAYNQSCTLTISLSGSQIKTPLFGGPQVCQQGTRGNPNPNQCYQPSIIQALNIRAATVESTLYTGAQNGLVYYSTNNGASWTATSSPAGGSAINSVFVTTLLYAGAANGGVYASVNQGANWSLIANPAPGFAVNGLYVSAINQLYIASANGLVFICSANGTQCVATSPPHAGFAVNGVFASTNALYAASADGNVYYSNNNGTSWIAINGQPDGSAVKTVFLAGNTLYASTANEYLYTSTSLTGGGAWTTYAQTVYSLFVSSDASQILAGNQAGYVFSLALGTQLGFVASTLINSLFLV